MPNDRRRVAYVAITFTEQITGAPLIEKGVQILDKDGLYTEVGLVQWLQGCIKDHETRYQHSFEVILLQDQGDANG